MQERVVQRRLSVLGLYHHDVGRNHGRNDLGAIHKIRRHFLLFFDTPFLLISEGLDGVLHHRHLPAFSNSSPEAEPAMEFMETAENEGGLAPMAMMTVIVSFHQRQGH